MTHHSGIQPGERRQPPIADYGFLSDCHSAALVDRTGSVDWWCVPRFDAPSVFARLLDAEAGHWSIRPVGSFDSTRAYVDGTLVLRTVWHTERGSVAVTDSLALAPAARGHDIGLDVPHLLIRRVEGLAGTVDMHMEFAPRMEYGRTQPHLSIGPGSVIAQGGPTRLSLVLPIPVTIDNGTAGGRFAVAPGDAYEFRLLYTPAFGGKPDPSRSDPTLEATVTAWQSWAGLHAYDGRFAQEVRRSSLVLQGLTYQPSGAVVAAATTSLPERLGGNDNYDYRYAWLRDFSLTIRSLWIAACPDEPHRLLDWFTNAAGEVGPELFQIMYGLCGERDLHEHPLEHLAGYHDSRPVRVGNEAWAQVQLDVLGEVLDAAYVLRDRIDEFGDVLQRLLVEMANRAADGWAAPDAGMWEARDAKRQYVTSKVMCWVALDRALRLGDRLGHRADPVRWDKAREEIRATVIEQAWSERAGAYAGALASDELDASVLLMPVVGFLPARDKRMWATIETIERELGSDGLVRRWSGDSGFLICTFWLVECLALGGETARAEAWFRSALAHANDLGLLAEEADPGDGTLLGNFPQAFSHVGLINAAWRLTQASSATSAEPTSDLAFS